MTVVAGDAWSACESLLTLSLITGPSQVSIVTKDCVAKEGTFAFAVDPCCNSTLRQTLCCAPRPVTQNVTILTGVDAAYVTKNCNKGKSFDQILSTLQNYIDFSNQINDKLLGCDAQQATALGTSDVKDYGSVFSTFTSFVETCQKIIYGTNDGQGTTCYSDQDCYTKCKKTKTNDPSSSGTCEVRFGTFRRLPSNTIACTLQLV